MPHSREVRPTSHDRHDPILVAALAAGDLAGTERDQATELITSCADCALLHADLLALARATAAAPPPFAIGARDFRLSPADAARLRPGGWRRVAAALSGVRAGVSRPLGVGLATIGLAGLLIGNVQIQLGGSAASAAPSDAAAAPQMVGGPEPSMLRDIGSTSESGGSPTAVEAQPVPGASAAASAAPPPGAFGAGQVPASTDNVAAVAAPSSKTFGAEPSTADLLAATGDPADQPFRPLNLVLGIAAVLGLGLIVLSFRRRPTA